MDGNEKRKIRLIDKDELINNLGIWALAEAPNDGEKESEIYWAINEAIKEVKSIKEYLVTEVEHESKRIE